MKTTLSAVQPGKKKLRRVSDLQMTGFAVCSDCEGRKTGFKRQGKRGDV